MKKIDKSSLEKMAKEKNIDKGKIEKMANNYKDKSEDELMSELVKVGKGLEGREEVVSKFKAFLDEEQQNKLDTIMQKISASEASQKTKKAKPERKKTTSSSKNLSSPNSKKSSGKSKGLLGKMKKSSPK
ncbi:hypothetical protein [Metaclostridioides mangenotii]|uniref:hypothetical protein n=1 Tax=Metaclostridioides mangenotii TaxID=1540 RepID=UPI0004635E24|nr:hypothetical protein [Clostridioides mangenotii]